MSLRRRPRPLSGPLRAPLYAWALIAAGCAPRRILHIESTPPGALVRLDETVIGRTPLEYPFESYGERRLTLYLPGYATLSERVEVAAPWHARFPIDLLTEVVVPMGLEDRHSFRYELQPDLTETHPEDVRSILSRAEGMREAIQARTDAE